MQKKFNAPIALVISLVFMLAGCAGWKDYEKTVDTRSIEGYAKETDSSTQGGVKYTVHYK